MEKSHYFDWLKHKMSSLRNALVVMVVFVLSLQTSVYATEKVLAVAAYSQEKSNWCWVAASKSIVKQQTGNTYAQCVLYMWGKGYDNCDSNETGSLYTELPNIFRIAGFRNLGYPGDYPVSFNTIKLEINANRPLYVRIGWKPTLSEGHAVPVRGYDDSNSYVHWIYINEVPQASEYKYTSYNYLKDNAQWSWTHTRWGMYY